jgi:large subunit ribosomal protein L19
MHPIERIEAAQRKTDPPEFRVGDTVDVHVLIDEAPGKPDPADKKKKEKDPGQGKEQKQRVQIFSGVVISRKNRGIRENFTVRRLVQGEGVERTFPVHSPLVEKVTVRRSGKVRRAKLYYLRGKTGKASRLREERGSLQAEEATTPPTDAPAQPAEAQPTQEPVAEAVSANPA